MLTRSLSIFVAIGAVASVCAVSAGAKTDIPVPNVPAGRCTDQSPPTSTFSSRAAKRVKRTHVLKGTARDVGCGIDKVEVSLARRVGKRCVYLASAKKMSRRRASCGRPAKFLPAKGTTRWSLRLPRKLAKGKYIVRTRATDFAGNVQRVRSKRLTIR